MHLPHVVYLLRFRGEENILLLDETFFPFRIYFFPLVCVLFLCTLRLLVWYTDTRYWSISTPLFPLCQILHLASSFAAYVVLNLLDPTAVGYRELFCDFLPVCFLLDSTKLRSLSLNMTVPWFGTVLVLKSISLYQSTTLGLCFLPLDRPFLGMFLGAE